MMNQLNTKIFGFTQSNLFRLQCLNDIYRTENLLRHCTRINSFSTHAVCYANPKPKSDQTDLVKARKSVYSELTVGEKVKQAGKDATYGGILVVGIGVTAIMFYYIGNELFSGKSPSGVYSKALKECIKNTEVGDTLGSPIKGYGEMNRRGRRRHVSHTNFEVEGVKHMRMKFYLEGSVHKGTVHLEVRENEAGKYEYRYLFVEVTDAPYRKTIVVQDNR